MTLFAVPFDPDADALAALAPASVGDRWRAIDRSAHAPHVIAAGAPDGSWTGAALVTARPGTAYVKIVDAVGDVAAVADAVISWAGERAAVQVKWEGWTVDERTATASGFRRLVPPLALADAPDQPPSGYVRWLVDADPAEPGYYRQSTDFSCGAVTALIAQTAAGVRDTASFDRTEELSLWREATNFNACEPFGLAVAVRRAWPDSPVAVALDVVRPVLLEHLDDAEAEWRAVLQTAARTQAAALGLPVSSERLSIAMLHDALASGERVLLLVSLAVMQGFDVPHWVLAHAGVPGAVVIEDPWFHAAVGDTWVDAHLLPIADDALDEMARIESDGFRGAVRLAP